MASKHCKRQGSSLLGKTKRALDDWPPKCKASGFEKGARQLNRRVRHVVWITQVFRDLKRFLQDWNCRHRMAAIHCRRTAEGKRRSQNHFLVGSAGEGDSPLSPDRTL